MQGLGHCAHENAETPQAREYYGQALQLYRQAGHRYGEANCVCRLGDCALDLGGIDAASDHYDRALALYDQIGDIHGKGNALMGLETAHACGPRATAPATITTGRGICTARSVMSAARQTPCNGSAPWTLAIPQATERTQAGLAVQVRHKGHRELHWPGGYRPGNQS